MDKRNTISINFPNPIAGIEKIKNSILAFALNIYNNPIRPRVSASRSILQSFKNFRFPRFNKKFLIRFVLPVFAVLIFVWVIAGLLRGFSTSGADINNGESVTLTLPRPVNEKELNKKVSFPLRDENGGEVGSFDYVVENAELRKQIIVKGQRATSIQGRIFLIFNLKLTNKLNQPIQINTRDYIRVTLNNNNEMLAPDIHNDPVEIQAISTKYTRVGLAIDEKDAGKIKLLFGEIEGSKETIEIDF